MFIIIFYDFLWFIRTPRENLEAFVGGHEVAS